jgi:hypothetical protein
LPRDTRQGDLHGSYVQGTPAYLVSLDKVIYLGAMYRVPQLT